MGKKDRAKKSGPLPSDKNIQDPQSQQSGKYSKRKLETNWSRYNEKIGEGDDGSRGVDFASASLQTRSDTAGSHFRFAQEKKWEEAAGGEAGRPVLDLTALSVEVAAVPLPERLRLERRLFSAGQIERFERDAVFHLAQIRARPPVAATTTTAAAAVVAALRPPTVDAPPAAQRRVPPPHPTDFEEVQLVERPSNVWGVEDSTNCLDLHSVSEELDMILSLPDSVEPVIGFPVAAAQVEPEPVVEMSEDWLDSLLND